MEYDYALSITTTIRNGLCPLFVSHSCFDTLILERNILNKTCLIETASNCAGITIIALSILLKLPIAFNIYHAKSAVGLSMASIVLEATMYLAVLVYYTSLGSPFSAYGEKYSLLSQNILLCVMIWFYGNCSNFRFVLYFIATVIAFLVMINIPKDFQPLLIAYTSVGSLLSRFPQIRLSYKNGHTGVLSFVTIAVSVTGGLVRVLTLLLEVDDCIIIIGESFPIFLNFIILSQIAIYRKATAAYLENKKK